MLKYVGYTQTIGEQPPNVEPVKASETLVYSRKEGELYKVKMSYAVMGFPWNGEQPFA